MKKIKLSDDLKFFLAILSLMVTGVCTIVIFYEPPPLITTFKKEANVQYDLRIKIQFPERSSSDIINYSEYHANQAGMTLGDTMVVGLVLPVKYTYAQPHWRILKVRDIAIACPSLVLNQYRGSVVGIEKVQKEQITSF